MYFAEVDSPDWTDFHGDNGRLVRGRTLYCCIPCHVEELKKEFDSKDEAFDHIRRLVEHDCYVRGYDDCEMEIVVEEYRSEIDNEWLWKP